MGIMKQDGFNPENDLLKDLFQQSAQEPDTGLKDQIMQSVEHPSVFKYEPVIGVKAWWAISGLFLCTVAYLLFWYRGNSGQPYFNLDYPSFDLVNFENWTSRIFHGVSFQLPDVSITIISALAAMMLIGVSFVVSYKNKVSHNIR